jgi:hypothetical protein
MIDFVKRHLGGKDAHLTTYASFDNFMHIQKGDTMRTTLDLPQDLIDEAMKATLIQTKTLLIITALEELVRKSKIAELKKWKGKVDLDIDLDVLRGR